MNMTMHTYEVFGKDFSKTYQAYFMQRAIALFKAEHPEEEIIRIDDLDLVRKFVSDFKEKMRVKGCAPTEENCITCENRCAKAVASC